MSETTIPVETPNAPSSSDEVLIQVNDLSKIYELGHTEVRALNGVSMTIRKNEYVSIMGPSGSGKSTLMNLIGCLDSPSQGEYFLDGVNVAHMTDDELAAVRNRKIGFVFQTFNLLPKSTALRNVELPLIYNGGIQKNQRKALAEGALKRVGLESRMLHKPNELSGGQRQRVAVARALVNNPAIILADEPTGNLDSKTGQEIMALFDELQQAGNTIILVTHEEDIALHAHRTIRLLDGKIASDEKTGNH
ncbi:MAG: macrolide ABC transporter ATP-binding protein [Candidatus Marinimicrobia bacterium CG1_02_48_14]|nr:MAG: macrolide ABC transporter ATP-binding protein [Candidatus Marinimicrobia bacterium CG1_02_48_14]PIZ69280.1 MAG: macrolide ABC transporter ATP-binding protein [Candidatus Marinimicrobia bacterium CG_4_10_14_0_2_um_filter_48_9]PJA51606.1 MAG: macrolide ABC transporter ATP-binding protein [Candidatus Marinimicrobia bacterium CG_4_9_14_3_um_filter_48_9]